MTSFSDLSIIIPSYNARHHLTRCLTAVRDALPGAEVIVIDGASSDDSATMVAKEHPEVRLHIERNHGWAYATNRGVELSTRRFLLFLNSDAYPTRDAVMLMLERLEQRRDVGAVAPMLRNEDGTRQALFGFWYWPTWRDIKKPTLAPVLSAACLMTSRERFEQVGAFDEAFFLYNEEFDWCRRAHKAGLGLEILPASVVHVGGGSTTKGPLLTLEGWRGFVYLSAKHWPRWVTRLLSQAMRLQGLVFKHVDPRPGYRSMWSQLESIMKHQEYTRSPFDVSGRGVPNLCAPLAREPE
jgi:GT2 family glycosyltransferase